MIVLLQKLEIKSVSYLSLKNGDNLSEALRDFSTSFSVMIFDLCFDVVENICLVRLVLLVTNIKSDLICVEICIIFSIRTQFFQKRCSSFWKLKMKLALGYLVVIKVLRLCLILVNEKQQPEDVSSEIFVFENVLSDCEGIS